MKTRIFRLLTATLCSLGQSGCYTQLHQYAWQRAKVVDDAWFFPLACGSPKIPIC